MLAGETDFHLKIITPDWESYQRFSSAKLTAAPNVSPVKSALMLRLSKNERGIPITEQPGPAAEKPVATSTEPTLTNPARSLLSSPEGSG